MSKSRRKSRISISVFLTISMLFLAFTLFVIYLSASSQYSYNSSKTKLAEAKAGEAYLNCQSHLNEMRAYVDQTRSYLVFFAAEYVDGSAAVGEFNDCWDNQIDPSISKLDTIIINYQDNLSKEKQQLLSDEFEYGVKEKLIEIRSLEITIASGFMGSSPEAPYVAQDDLINLSDDINELSESFDKILNSFSIDNNVDRVVAQPIPFSTVLIIIAILGGFTVLMAFVLLGWIKRPIIRLQRAMTDFSNGDVPDEFQTRSLDYSEITLNLNQLSENLRNVKGIAEEIGKGQFDYDIKVFNNEGELGRSFLDMKESLKRVAEEDKQRNKVNEGLAKFSEILGNYTNDLAKFGDEIIFNLVKFLEANQGAIFTAAEDEEEGQEALEMIACYAYDKKKYLNKKIKKGQGLAGQAWQEGKRIYLTEVPEKYVFITSGLGYSTPRSILIVPLNFNDETHGVIEIASFRELESYELEFVQKASESIASALASVKVNDKTQKLLDESKELTEQMRAQEEEMRQNMEELQATQEEMQRREEERENEIKELKAKLKDSKS